MDWVKEVKLRAELGKPLVRGGKTGKQNRVSWDDLIFAPSQLSTRIVDYFREEVSSKTVIGRRSKRPLELETPIIIAAMSFGALSREAKIALAKASTIAGTATNTGEGGMLPEERKEAKILIAQYSTGRFGVDEDYIKNADAIEIKIGQGAKPNQGGLLPGEKVTEEIAKIRKVPVGKPIHSPPMHPDIKSVEDLKQKVEWLRGLNDGPVIIKLAATDVEKDVRLAVEAEPDAIAIDGMEGGTGAAPVVMMDDFGIPALAAVVKARKVLDEIGGKQELLIGGGLSKGADVAKALALGADAVFMGFPMLVAMGCVYCRKCHLGKCPVGITTQDPELRKKLDVEVAAGRVVNFIRACTEEVKMVAAACGKRDVHKLGREELRALSLLVSKVTGVPLV